MSFSNLKIDKDWTLFLDRDGVINERIAGGYVTRRDEFILLEGVEKAFNIFNHIFGKIIVVSNQQGIGKGLMTNEQVNEIHNKLLNLVQRAGGRIDAIYYSPHLESDRSGMRKPGSGMALCAREDFPGIRFAQSLMAGDTLSDMEFGRRLGMKTVLISGNKQDKQKGEKMIDYNFPDLIAFASSLIQHH